MSADAPATNGRLQEMTMVIYTAITLLGVIAAATWKNTFADEPELLVIIAGTTITLAVAHAWSAIVAHRIVHREGLTSRERSEELRSFLASCAVGAVAAVTLMVTWASWLDLDTSVRATSLALIAILFITGMAASRKRGGSWLLAAAWGLLNASIGVVIFVAKILFS